MGVMVGGGTRRAGMHGRGDVRAHGGLHVRRGVCVRAPGTCLQVARAHGPEAPRDVSWVHMYDCAVAAHVDAPDPVLCSAVRRERRLDLPDRGGCCPVTTHYERHGGLRRVLASRSNS